MKKLLFIGICMIGMFHVSAQLKKGAKVVSLTATVLPTASSDSAQDVGLLVKTHIEFMIGNRWSYVTHGFYAQNTTFQNEGGQTVNSVGVIPGLQYYVYNKEKWQIYAQAGYGFGFTDRSFGSGQNGALTILTAGLGARYAMSDRLFFQLELPYFKAQNITLATKEAEGPLPFIGISYAF